MTTAYPNTTHLESVPSPPKASSRKARKVMQGNKSVSTPEIALRSELHRRGLRFRKHASVVPGLRCRPDVVFPRKRIAVECRGCFWHLCPKDAVLPKSNQHYWLPKLMHNVERDLRNERALAEAGWTLIVVWEHEETIDAANRIEQLVRSQSAVYQTARPGTA
jgi:DNA mismatch endonuclease (patch repair protein)